MNVLGYEWNDRKVLVTGASGFKGSWLCAALIKMGARVYGTVRNQRNPLSAFEVLDLDQRVVKVSADISERQDVYDTLNSIEPDVIFHLAAKALVPVSLRDPRRTFDVNIMGTLNIIEACRKLKVSRRLLICSTDHVFGNIEPHELPAKGFEETGRVSYGGPYDTSKAAMELMVRCYHNTYWSELPAIGITRCANVFGCGDTNQRRIIPLFVRSAVQDKTIPLKYLQSGRQFIHITDAVAGYILAASMLNDAGIEARPGTPRPDNRTPFTPTYHFAIESYEGTDAPFIRMQELAQVVADAFTARINATGATAFPLNENRIQALNCAQTRAQLRWQPRTSMQQGVKELGQWYQAENDRTRLAQLANQDLELILAEVQAKNIS